MTNPDPTKTGSTTWLLGQDAEHRLTAIEVTLAGEPTVVLRDELDPATPGAVIRTAPEAANLIQVLRAAFGVEPHARELETDEDGVPLYPGGGREE